MCQQAKGGDTLPLPIPGEVTPGLLCPVLGSSVWKRRGATGEGPAEVTKMMRGLKHLFYEKKTAGAEPVYSGEENTKKGSH